MIFSYNRYCTVYKLECVLQDSKVTCIHVIVVAGYVCVLQLEIATDYKGH